MGLWDGLRSRLFGDDEPERVVEEDREPSAHLADDDTREGIGAPSFADEVIARQERAAGRILDDEGLRGDLTDDEYQPLLDWALGATDQIAAGTAEQDDEQAEAVIDAGIGVVREVVRAAGDAVVAHNEGRAEDRRWALDTISQTWKPSIIGGDESDLPGALWRPLQELADRLEAEPGLLGPDVAAATAAALGQPAADESATAGGAGQTDGAAAWSEDAP